VLAIPNHHARKQVPGSVVDMPRRCVYSAPDTFVHVTCDVTESQRPPFTSQRRLPARQTLRRADKCEQKVNK